VDESILLVIPVFNEEKRWNEEYFLELASKSDNRLKYIFVDDGSTDNSKNLIRALCDKSDRFFYRFSDSNQGKGEAIRNGFSYGVTENYSGIGFLDSDGAFSTRDINRISTVFIEKCLKHDDFQAIWSSRISLAGRRIERSNRRHVLGRLISKIVSPFTSGIPWDTQSGFKIFKNNPGLRELVSQRFQSKWLFEIEMLQRYIVSSGTTMKIWEEPLDSWHDVKGSKIQGKQYVIILAEITLIFSRNLNIIFKSLKNRITSEH
jgi:glycosyltransferase involved in cell wall biosynthesis